MKITNVAPASNHSGHHSYQTNLATSAFQGSGGAASFKAAAEFRVRYIDASMRLSRSRVSVWHASTIRSWRAVIPQTNDLLEAVSARSCVSATEAS
jgi:hypothetical protein